MLTHSIPHLFGDPSAMFTFGRDKEKRCALQYTRDKTQAPLIEAVIDQVHDFIEERTTIDSVCAAIENAFCTGGSGVWEQTGSWLRKLSAKQPTFLDLWTKLADCTDHNVRFRVACFINEMPHNFATEIGKALATDRSRKVREMAAARLEEIGTDE